MSSTKGIHKTCKRTWPAFVTDRNPRVSLSEEQLKGLFRRFDTDGDGCLSKQELIQAFDSLGSMIPGWRAWRALCHADANGDGYIDKSEFNDLVKYALKHGYTIN